MTEGIEEARFTQEGDRVVNIESARNTLALVPEIAERLEDHRGETILQGVTEDGLFIGVKKGTTENKIIAVVTAVLTGSPQMIKQSIDATVFPGTEEQFFRKFAGKTGVDYRPDGSLRRIPSDDFMDVLSHYPPGENVEAGDVIVQSFRNFVERTGGGVHIAPSYKKGEPPAFSTAGGKIIHPI